MCRGIKVAGRDCSLILGICVNPELEQKSLMQLHGMAYNLKNLWIISDSEFSYAGCGDLGSLEKFNFKLEFILAWCKKKKIQKGPGQGHKAQETRTEKKIFNFWFWKENSKKEKKHSKTLERFNLEQKGWHWRFHLYFLNWFLATCSFLLRPKPSFITPTS